MSPVANILSENIIAHETAHQWWGDLLSWKSYRDQWLFEALANYSALLLLESESPPQFRMVMEKYRQNLLAKNKEGSPLADAGPVTFGTRLNCSHFPDGYDAISYGRGTWLFHMLRNMLRDAERSSRGRSVNLSDAQADAPFLRALSKARERFQERAINTREFLQVFEEELPPSLRYEGRKSLDWFYEGWVNGTALPHLELQSVKYTQNWRLGGQRHDCSKRRAPGVGDPGPGLRRGCREECSVRPGIRRRPGNQLSTSPPRLVPEDRTRSLPDAADSTLKKLGERRARAEIKSKACFPKTFNPSQNKSQFPFCGRPTSRQAALNHVTPAISVRG